MRRDPLGNTSRDVLPNVHPNLEEEIRRLAYELYEDRDRKDGHDLDDWLRAEAEIMGAAV